jgi:hypothetical protein
VWPHLHDRGSYARARKAEELSLQFACSCMPDAMLFNEKTRLLSKQRALRTVVAECPF